MSNYPSLIRWHRKKTKQIRTNLSVVLCNLKFLRFFWAALDQLSSISWHTSNYSKSFTSSTNESGLSLFFFFIWSRVNNPNSRFCHFSWFLTVATSRRYWYRLCISVKIWSIHWLRYSHHSRWRRLLQVGSQLGLDCSTWKPRSPRWKMSLLSWVTLSEASQASDGGVMRRGRTRTETHLHP